MKRIIVILIMFLFALSCEKDDSKPKKQLYECLISYICHNYDTYSVDSYHDYVNFCSVDKDDAKMNAYEYCNSLLGDNCESCHVGCRLIDETGCN